MYEHLERRHWSKISALEKKSARQFPTFASHSLPEWSTCAKYFQANFISEYLCNVVRFRGHAIDAVASSPIQPIPPC